MHGIARSAAFLGLLLVSAGCALRAARPAASSSEVIVHVTNAGAVPLRLRVCGDPCSAYLTAAPAASVTFHLPATELSRFMLTVMQGDRLVAQEPFTARSGTAVSLAVDPPAIERLSNR